MTIDAKPGVIAVDTTHAECPAGFRSAGLAVGMRRSGKKDLALFLCPAGASAAGVFTQNLVRAAPVEISVSHLRTSAGRAHAILINSACANAATGVDGDVRARRTVRAVAEAGGFDAEHVLVASTGVIGATLRDDLITGATPALFDAATGGSLLDAAEAIMTTDTCTKMAEARAEWNGRTLHVAGVAKGSGMIHPNMATMLGVVMTDAAVEPDTLGGMLRDATSKTFNRISVDGDTSTNDCVFALASGEAGEFPESLVAECVERVCRELAMHIVRDGEGASRVIHVRVEDARTRAEAEQVADAVGGSLLVRTAVSGGDPNWGRILAAIGRSGAPVKPERLRVLAGGEALFEDGAPAATPRERLEKAFREDTVELEIHLGRGRASGEFFTCDLTAEYVRINADYTT